MLDPAEDLEIPIIGSTKTAKSNNLSRKNKKALKKRNLNRRQNNNIELDIRRPSSDHQLDLKIVEFSQHHQGKERTEPNTKERMVHDEYGSKMRPTNTERVSSETLNHHLRGDNSTKADTCETGQQLLLNSTDKSVEAPLF